MGKGKRHLKTMEKRTSVLAGSHIPVLVKLLNLLPTDKPILELGLGWNSTPLLHWITKDLGTKLYSVESDSVWLSRFKQFEDKHHKIFPVFDFMDWSKCEFLEDIPQNLGLVFVDHRPARKRRSSALFFKDRANFIVLHDSELADHPAYKYTPIYKEFRYKYEDTKFKPHTIILSNFIDPDALFIS